MVDGLDSDDARFELRSWASTREATNALHS
jgi:hypothetical protein